jgi:photosynthetic reaction center cytochrome c subunit
MRCQRQNSEAFLSRISSDRGNDMRLKKVLLRTLVSVPLLVFCTGQLHAQTAQSSAHGIPKASEQVYKNIQVLKGVPADQFIPAMQFIAASLGVQCDFCHIENAFDKDDKETKQTARKMMRMMFTINKDNFDGHQEITCFACHRGARKPLIIPSVNQDEVKVAEEEKMRPEETTGLPAAEQIVAKYLQAIGGAEAVAKISTRIQKGTLTVGAKSFPVEVLAQAPAKRITTVGFPGGESVTGINGAEGWLSTAGRAPHEMGPSELDAAKLDAELFFPTYLKQIFRELRVQKRELLNGKQAYVVLGMREGQLPVELYFDEESGLLLRIQRYTDTPVGRNPTQIEFADYRSEGGVKTPFRWTVARPNGRFTIQIEQMQQSIPIEENRFAKPPVAPPSS